MLRRCPRLFALWPLEKRSAGAGTSLENTGRVDCFASRLSRLRLCFLAPSSILGRCMDAMARTTPTLTTHTNLTVATFSAHGSPPTFGSCHHVSLLRNANAAHLIVFIAGAHSIISIPSCFSWHLPLSRPPSTLMNTYLIIELFHPLSMLALTKTLITAPHIRPEREPISSPHKRELPSLHPFTLSLPLSLSLSLTALSPPCTGSLLLVYESNQTCV
jgi:hypothetical protein